MSVKCSIGLTAGSMILNYQVPSCGQSYEASTSENYNSGVVNRSNLLVIMTQES